MYKREPHVCFEEHRKSNRVQQNFAFHYQGRVFKGYNLSKFGIGIGQGQQECRDFCFYRTQRLKNCHIEILGETIKFSTLDVCWTENSHEGLIYGLEIKSILPKDKIKFERLFEKVSCHNETTGSLNNLLR